MIKSGSGLNRIKQFLLMMESGSGLEETDPFYLYDENAGKIDWIGL